MLLLVWLCWGPISRWMQRQAMRRTEDMLRRMTGQPTRKEAEKQARDNEKRQQQRRQRQQEAQEAAQTVQSMREYAEDVEFTEIKEFTEEIEIKTDPKTGRSDVRVESQVSDVEFTETRS